MGRDGIDGCSGRDGTRVRDVAPGGEARDGGEGCAGAPLLEGGVGDGGSAASRDGPKSMGVIEMRFALHSIRGAILLYSIPG